MVCSLGDVGCVGQVVVGVLVLAVTLLDPQQEVLQGCCIDLQEQINRSIKNHENG